MHLSILYLQVTFKDGSVPIVAAIILSWFTQCDFSTKLYAYERHDRSHMMSRIYWWWFCVAQSLILFCCVLYGLLFFIPSLFGFSQLVIDLCIWIFIWYLPLFLVLIIIKQKWLLWMAYHYQKVLICCFLYNLIKSDIQLFSVIFLIAAWSKHSSKWILLPFQNQPNLYFIVWTHIVS